MFEFYFYLIFPRSRIFTANLFLQSGQIKNAEAQGPEPWYSKSTTDNVIALGPLQYINRKTMDLIRLIIACYSAE